ncbi:hypothetical protein LguiB_018411 [Lonicera macranthoides]
MTETTPPSLPILSFLLFILPFHVNSQTINDQEQPILLSLKQYWSNPSLINHWAPSSNSTTHCSWPEITCTGGSVTGIALVNKGITGDIPPSICDLKNLTTIDLSYNEISGPFPTVLYNCSNLQYLDLSQNFFVGRIPLHNDQLSHRLQCLSLSANKNNPPGILPLKSFKDKSMNSRAIKHPIISGISPMSFDSVMYRLLSFIKPGPALGQGKQDDFIEYGRERTGDFIVREIDVGEVFEVANGRWDISRDNYIDEGDSGDGTAGAGDPRPSTVGGGIG